MYIVEIDTIRYTLLYTEQCVRFTVTIKYVRILFMFMYIVEIDTIQKDMYEYTTEQTIII